VVNAVAHRDYSLRGDSIRLLMFSDRMEVYSPGRLPGHVTLDNLLKDERFSRNEVIVQVLSDLGFIERLGYGIDRMIAAMQEAGLPAPRFEETAAGFRVTLLRRRRPGERQPRRSAGATSCSIRARSRPWPSSPSMAASPTARFKPSARCQPGDHSPRSGRPGGSSLLAC
jgi:predicted HTH transcriptional regulator